VSLRVLHVLDHSAPLHSGYAFRTAAILREQRAFGWTPIPVTGVKQECVSREEEHGGFRYYRTDPLQGPLASVPVLGELWGVRRLRQRVREVILRERVDLVHAHSPVLNAMAALEAAHSLHRPVVYEVRALWEDAAVDHGTEREGDLRYRLTRSLETKSLRQADAVTVICEGLRSDIAARGVPAEKITVIPNAVDVDRFRPGGAPDPALARSLGLDGARVLGFIGSFYGYEGLPLLVRALPLVAAREPGARLLFVGGGPEDEALRALTRSMNLEGRVVFVGRVPHEEIGRYYDLIDVLVYPRLSTRTTELVTPLKPLEAMAQGRLLLASDVGGHRELIKDGETGVLFRAGDPEALAGAAVALLRAPDRWPALREAARGFVERERSWSRSVRRYETVYTAAFDAFHGR
jgi:PEP-CTERM/exosortase A-associated glycosyltransferase